MASCQVQRLLGNSDRSLGLGGHVGFHTLPDQLVNKSVNKGFDFNVLCVGETGCGKSTLMESLFKQDFKEQPVTHQLPEVGITATTHRLQEGNVKLRLTLVSTKGYGDQIDKSNSIKPLLDYIDEQFEAYLQEELKIKRDLVNFHDTRVHVCLYFISPTGHSIKSLDLVCMQQLDKKVNIIPVIAKADTISRTELQEFKGRIMRELVNNGIEIYQFPVDDETFAENNARMNEQLPFAVVGSRDEVVVGGQKVRARIYPWGTVEVENESHCDFVKLREMILRTNMEDLRESTHTKHYEMFRRERLHQRGFADTMDNRPVSLQETYEKKRKELQLEMKTKEEQMRHTFVQKVKDKEAELKAAEHRLHEEFERLRKKHQEDKAALEEKKRGLDEEISFFNQKKAAIQAQRAQTELYHKSKQQRK